MTAQFAAGGLVTPERCDDDARAKFAALRVVCSRGVVSVDLYNGCYWVQIIRNGQTRSTVGLSLLEALERLERNTRDMG